MKLPKLIGVIHLGALGGSPGANGIHPAEALQEVGAIAVEEAGILVEAGFDGIILENFGDTPFYKTQVPPITIASMSIIAAAVREATDGIQLGINVLRNDVYSALAIAAATGCDFIRANVLTGVAATDQGLIEGDAAGLLRERDRLQVSVGILADIHVKHAQTLSTVDLTLAMEDATVRGRADGVIVTGHTTGRLADLGVIQEASKKARHLGVPIFLGSGATQEKLKDLRPWLDGIIVGSTLREGGKPGAPLDRKRTVEFAKEFARLRPKKVGISKKKAK